MLHAFWFEYYARLSEVTHSGRDPCAPLRIRDAADQRCRRCERRVDMDRLDETDVYLPDLWSTHAETQPDKPAIVCGDITHSWGQFDRSMNRVANAFLSRGI